jgi:hypothetical protein
MKVNIFTKDLEALFKLKNDELGKEISKLEADFNKNKSVRAASLLSWFYLLGNYADHQGTRDWPKSLSYLKNIIKLSEANLSLTRGSSHNSFLLFLLQQSSLI